MDVAITELEKIEADRIDGVGMPANGIPVLLFKQVAEPVAEPEVVKAGMRDCPKCGKGHDADHKGNTCEACGADLPAADAAKAVGADGQVDEAPDLDIAGQILALIGQAIGSESSEVSAGHPEELADVHMLARAGEIVATWQAREQAVADGKDPNAPCGCCEWCEGMGCGCCPSCGPGLLMCAAAADAMSKAAQRKPGEDTSKSQIAKDGVDVDTVTQTGGLAKAVEEAVAKATAPLRERLEALGAELAKVKATPVPSGLVLSHNVQVKAPGAVVNEQAAKNAARYWELADTVTDRQTADGYRELARKAEEQAKTPA